MNRGVQRKTRATVLLAAAGTLLLVLGCEDDDPGESAEASAEDIAAGKAIYEEKCTSCHTIG
ncbi:MAG: c-type cytochrome, partial [Myxococcota bacterium]